MGIIKEAEIHVWPATQQWRSRTHEVHADKFWESKIWGLALEST